MALNRDKFRNIVGGITTPETAPATVPAALPVETASDDAGKPPSEMPTPTPPEQDIAGPGVSAEQSKSVDIRRFAKRGRPKGGKSSAQTGPIRKVKVSLFLSEVLVNDLYEWAHADRMHPGEMFEQALKPFHEKETKRRNGGKG